MLCIGYEQYGDEKELKSDPLKHLYEVYVKVCQAAEKDENINKLAIEYFSRLTKGSLLT